MKTAPSNANSSPFTIPRDIFFNLAQHLDVVDLSRVSRSCKQGTALRQQLIENPASSASRGLVQTILKRHEFDRLISLFKTSEKETSEYPLELRLEGSYKLEDIKQLFSFFTHIRKLHFVNFSFTFDRSYKEKEIMGFIGKNCSSVEDFAIINDKIWDEGPVAESFPVQHSKESDDRLAIVNLLLKCSSLKRLDLSGCDGYFLSKTLPKLQHNTTIESVRANPCIDTKTLNHLLSQCQNLKELTLNCNSEKVPAYSLGDLDVSLLIPSATLTSLELLQGKLTDETNARLYKIFPNLQYLA